MWRHFCILIGHVHSTIHSKLTCVDTNLQELIIHFIAAKYAKHGELKISNYWLKFPGIVADT